MTTSEDLTPPVPTEASPAGTSRLLRWGVAAAAAFGAVTAVVVVGKGTSAPAPAPARAERSTPWLEGGVIRYPSGFAEREQLTFVAAEERDLTPSIFLTGQVTWDARRVAAIGARIEGRLRALTKVEGEDVQVGEVVAELESVELGRAQAEVLKVRAREQVARSDADRERRLADSKISAERDAQFAAANAEALTAERMAAEKAVEAMGGTLGGEVGVLKLRSPIAGAVVKLDARRGQTVGPTDTILVVADPARVWVEFTVFERDVPAIREGDAVDIALPADPTAVLHGPVSHISESLDPETRAGHVRVELDNRSRTLRAGQSVTGTVHATGPRERRLVVPKQAVTRIDGTPTVFVQVNDSAVEPRKVKLGPDDATAVAVIEGLAAGERVVTTGVLALKAEVFR